CIDLIARRGFSDTKKHAIPKLGKKLLESKSERAAAFHFHNKFVETRSGKKDPMFCPLLDFVYGIVRFQNVLFGNLSKANWSDRGEVNRRHERTQGLIGTNVGRGFLASYVLFTSRECQHETGSTGMISAQPDEPARHLPYETFARCEKTDVRPTETGRHTERLSLAKNNVGCALFRTCLTGRLQ